MAHDHVDAFQLQERHHPAMKLPRAVGVTQKSAWFMLHRIRMAMKNTHKKKFGFGGPIESQMRRSSALILKNAQERESQGASAG